MRTATYAPAYGFGRGIRAAAWMSPSSSEVSICVVMVPLQRSSAALSAGSGAAAPRGPPAVQSAAWSSSGFSAGCWSASAAPGVSSTCWNAFCRASAFKTCFTVGSG